MRPPLLALLPLAATLATQAAGQTIRGAGARPCADWVQARAGNGHDYEAEQWALGYMSGVNAVTKGQGIFRNTDGRTIFAGLDSYCGAHRQDMFWNAVKSVIATPHGA
jgi:hypothetical protein